MISDLYARALARNSLSGPHFPDGRLNRLLLRLTVIGSLLIAGLYIGSSGSVFAAVAVVGAVCILTVTVYRIDWGFLVFVGMVMFFDQMGPRGFERSIIGVDYFKNLKSLPVFENVGPAVMTPLEIHLLLIFIVWVILIVAGKQVFLSRPAVWIPAAVFFAGLTAAIVMGLGRGGEFLPALWETRALFYLGIMLLFVPQIIQTEAQVRQLVWVIIGALSFKTLQGVVRLVNLGFSFGGRNELSGHEDPLFFVSLLILGLSLYLFRGNRNQMRAIGLISIPMLTVFILGQRRATWAALAVSLLGFLFLIEKHHRTRVLKFLIPLSLIGGLYLAAFWNSPPGGIGHAATLVKSSFSSEKETAGERYYSNLYRDLENYNLAQTLKRSPLVGIGFGNKYDQPIKLPNIPYTLAEYIPHNEILWVIVKMGSIGFLLFFFLVNSVVFRAAALFRHLKDPYLRSICAMTIVAVLGQIIVSFYDLQLTYYRNMIYLGVLIGIFPTLERTEAEKASIRA